MKITVEVPIDREDFHGGGLEAIQQVYRYSPDEIKKEIRVWMKKTLSQCERFSGEKAPKRRSPSCLSDKEFEAVQTFVRSIPLSDDVDAVVQSCYTSGIISTSYPKKYLLPIVERIRKSISKAQLRMPKGDSWKQQRHNGMRF